MSLPFTHVMVVFFGGSGFQLPFVGSEALGVGANVGLGSGAAVGEAVGEGVTTGVGSGSWTSFAVILGLLKVKP